MRERLVDRGGRIAALVGVTTALLLAVALAPGGAAQDTPGLPTLPHWFYGVDSQQFDGATVRAIGDDDSLLASAVVEDGVWSVQILPVDADSVTFELELNGDEYATGAFNVLRGRITEVEPSQFAAVVEATIEAQVRARFNSERNQIEFGVRRVGGEDILPRQRYFPTNAAEGAWLRSSEIDLGDGYIVRIIARVTAADSNGRGRVEFGLRVGTSSENLLPRGRYFPASPDPDRWLSSTPVTVTLP